MGPFGIIEQDPAAGRIRRAADRGTLSHALLFTGGGDLLSAARFAAAAMECTAPGGRPCGVCQGCRKTLADIHPDVVTVRDEQHKLIAVDAVRAVRSDAYVRPNEGQRKVYLFPDCALLTEQDQNVLLKLVEEGPPYAAFLFCAENASGVLPTLRSRCVELKLRPAGSGGAASENGGAPPRRGGGGVRPAGARAPDPGGSGGYAGLEPGGLCPGAPGAVRPSRPGAL